MPRTIDETRRWMKEGTELLLDAVSSLDERAGDEPSALPGWSRRFLLAHIAANSDALQNLVNWATTGLETPMYASPEARAAGIEAGSKLPAAELLRWLRVSANELEAGMSALTEEQWRTEVVTAQGRTVRATETPWMRAREVFVHTVDLRIGVSFADLPPDFLNALQTEILQKRAGAGEEVPDVSGTLEDVTAYLAGREYISVALPDGTQAPELGPWL